MNEIIAAGIGAMVSLVLSTVVTLKEGSRFFSNIVSGERMTWVKEVRALTAKLMALCEMYDEDTLPAEQRAVFLETRNDILIHLNPASAGYSLDSELHDLLSSPDISAIKENLPRIRELICTILKSEWDKVKIEAGNSPHKIKKIEKLQEQIEHRRKSH